MEEIRIGILGLFIVNLVFGFLFGTFPLVAGIVTGNRKYAFLGSFLSFVGGGILGVFLSFPLAMVFLWLILKRRGEAQAQNNASSPTEAEV